MLDARAFARPVDATLSPALQQWPTIKGLILIGYYTSEIGASQELRYVLVPGRFDPDVKLEPGDLIATGTPAGVGLGMKPQVWLQPGDQIRMEIDQIGVLANPVA